jgi:hypothetical protein
MTRFTKWWFGKMGQRDIYPTVCIQCWDGALELAAEYAKDYPDIANKIREAKEQK